MARTLNISPKKTAKQARAVETVRAIVEAASYILRRRGIGDYTAHKVAEKAGVNIASFYQYFPNKEALLFHIIKSTWEKQLAELTPILTREGKDYAAKLRDFLRAFFVNEAAEADLRQALRTASVELKDTKEYQALIAQGAALFTAFIEKALGKKASDFEVSFVVLMTTSFAERTTDVRTPIAELIRQADLMSDMLIVHFKIG